MNLTRVYLGDETMYAGIVFVQFLPGKMDEAIRIYRDDVVPAAKQQNGYIAHYLLTDRKNNKAISIALWETEADMTATKTSGHYQQQLAKFKDIFAAPSMREDYEVSVQA
ncbi:MAG TPA: antibiotic biosynthesis monooxygenase [Anaerolineaceae bacterium]|nr:antibiotic biosynthesis monooxygenase [Anaerolineaceae bacterium]